MKKIILVCLLFCGLAGLVKAQYPIKIDPGKNYGALLAPKIKPGKYFFKTALADKYLDARDGNHVAGTPVQLWDLHGLWGEVWEVMPSDEADYFFIKSEMGRYLEVQKAVALAGVAVQIGDFNGGGSTQKWKFISTVGGYNIQSKLGTYLDVRDARAVNGNAVWMWSKQNDPALSKAQLWGAVSAGKGNELVGYVDMHTHPMSYLGFGKKVIHGVPDVGLLLPAGTNDCNPTDRRTTSIADALGNCNATHGGWGTENSCGDYIRASVLNLAIDGDFANVMHVTQNLHGDHQHKGFPEFVHWPHQTSITHQQMWHEWLKRTYENGLRGMVALTVNSELVAEIINGDGPKDDRSSADLQISEIKRFVARHNGSRDPADNWMEIATNASEYNAIIRSNRLAIILGMEVDNIGNFNKNNAVEANNPTEQGKRIVVSEIDRLFNMGIRYIFPVHLVDNKFGGTAVYQTLFNFANHHANGSYFSVKSDPAIKYNLSLLGTDTPWGLENASVFAIRSTLEGIGELPVPGCLDLLKPECITPVPGFGKIRCCGSYQKILSLITPSPAFDDIKSIPSGHVNKKGLSLMGKFAVTEMMRRGMIIDLDHMSQMAVNESLELAERFQYPVNSGHNGERPVTGNEITERNFTLPQFKRIARLGGMMGVGTSDTDAQDFIRNYSNMLYIMENKNVAIGTDVNGWEKLPRAILQNGVDRHGVMKVKSNVVYDAGFQRCRTEGGRVWDYNVEGVAHYGLMPDFLKDVQNRLPAATKRGFMEEGLMKSAEYFSQMWEKCERARFNVR